MADHGPSSKDIVVLDVWPVWNLVGNSSKQRQDDPVGLKRVGVVDGPLGRDA